MTFKPLHIVALSLLLSLTACNAKSGSSPIMTEATQPIPQAGGYSNIDNAFLAGLIAKGVTVVDIRRQEEWQQTGIVKGSKTITFFDNRGQINPNFLSEFTAITKSDQPVALICRTGNRTSIGTFIK